MKVLLFTHSQDIDGMGCAILGYQAFQNITVVPTKTFDITANVKKYIDNQEIKSYDQVFVTDLCIKEPLLKEIDGNDVLKSKILVLDHHKTEIEEGNNKYDFVHIIVEQNGRKESGTSLFYQYLLEHQLLESNPIMEELVEWTREYDVWDWKKTGNKNAKNLHILFETLGYQEYVNIMNEKLNHLKHIEFSEFETSIINEFEQKVEEEIDSFLKKMKVVTLTSEGKNYKVGYIRCPYKYRNDVNEHVILKGIYDIDVIGMIMTDIDTVSYRQIKDVDVSAIAKLFGGKGHFAAASNTQGNEQFKNMLQKNKI